MVLFHNWHWTMTDVEKLDFDEFCLLADAVKKINEAEAKAQGR